jgi:hypothetical protein
MENGIDPQVMFDAYNKKGQVKRIHIVEIKQSIDALSDEIKGLYGLMASIEKKQNEILDLLRKE